MNSAMISRQCFICAGKQLRTGFPLKSVIREFGRRSNYMSKLSLKPVFKFVDHQMKVRPYSSNALISCLLMGLGDLVQQTWFNPTINWKEVMLYFKFGFTNISSLPFNSLKVNAMIISSIICWDVDLVMVIHQVFLWCALGLTLGPICVHWYARLELWYPGLESASVFRKVAIDEIVTGPIYASFIFYLLPLIETFEHHTACSEWKQKFLPTCIVSAMCWSVFGTINFRFVPIPYRIAYIFLFDFVYDICASTYKYQFWSLLTFKFSKLIEGWTLNLKFHLVSSSNDLLSKSILIVIYSYYSYRRGFYWAEPVRFIM